MKRFFILLAAVGLSISAFSSSVSNATVLVQNTPTPKVVVPNGYKHYTYETDKKGVIMDYDFILPATNADAKAAVARMCAILNVNQQKLRSNDLESVLQLLIVICSKPIKRTTRESMTPKNPYAITEILK